MAVKFHIPTSNDLKLLQFTFSPLFGMISFQISVILIGIQSEYLGVSLLYNLQFPDVLAWFPWCIVSSVFLYICYLYIIFGEVTAYFLSIIAKLYEFFLYFAYKSFIRCAFYKYSLPLSELSFHVLKTTINGAVFNFVKFWFIMDFNVRKS